jgi:ribosomal protein L23
MVKDHIAGQLDFFGVFGDFSEEHVERSHHNTNVHDRTLANIQDWENKNKIKQSRESQYSTKLVKVSTIVALESAKRSFKSSDGLSALARKKLQKEKERDLKIVNFVNSLIS